MRDVVNGKETKSYWYLYSGHKSVSFSTYKNLVVEKKRRNNSFNDTSKYNHKGHSREGVSTNVSVCKSQ